MGSLMNVAFLKTSLLSLITLASALALTGCGSSGGDDDFIGAAHVSISASPTTIDTGDRTSIKITISDLHKDGILLKIYHPSAFSYVQNSASLRIEDKEYHLDPDIDIASGEFVKAGRFLVFFLSHKTFGESQYGELRFELEGMSTIRSGEVGVDADVNDPLIDDSVEFEPSDPKYASEASVWITVIE